MASADGSEAANVPVNISDVRLANMTAHNSCARCAEAREVHPNHTKGQSASNSNENK